MAAVKKVVRMQVSEFTPRCAFTLFMESEQDFAFFDSHPLLDVHQLKYLLKCQFIFQANI